MNELWRNHRFLLMMSGPLCVSANSRLQDFGFRAAEKCEWLIIGNYGLWQVVSP